MNQARFFTIFSIVSILALFSRASELIIPAQAPLTLKYQSDTAVEQEPFLFRIHSLSPDIKIEWEQDFRMGAVIVSSKDHNESHSVYRRTRLANGREVKLKGSLLGVSTAVCSKLLTGEKVKLKINDVSGWMQKTGVAEFSLQGYQIPVIVVVDNVGNEYQIQKNPDFPLCLRFRSTRYEEHLEEYYQGSDILFRWFK